MLITMVMVLHRLDGHSHDHVMHSSHLHLLVDMVKDEVDRVHCLKIVFARLPSLVALMSTENHESDEVTT